MTRRDRARTVSPAGAKPRHPRLTVVRSYLRSMAGERRAAAAPASVAPAPEAPTAGDRPSD